jgi:outer membrane lipoprotein
MKWISRLPLVSVLLMLLSACASPVPQAIRVAPPDAPSLAAVRAAPGEHLGQQVRWGGTLIATDNRENTTWLTMLGRPLGSSGRPDWSDESDGRFIAIVPEFLDPKLYAPDRRLTVTGTLLRTEAGKVGEHPYTYPVVAADAWYLWPLDKRWRRRYPDPWWHDPRGCRPWYYDPWYPYSYPYWP